MASLNWVLLNPNLTPVPLPNERFLKSFHSISVTLTPNSPALALPSSSSSSSSTTASKGAPLNVNGKVYVSEMRIVVVSDTAKHDAIPGEGILSSTSTPPPGSGRPAPLISTTPTAASSAQSTSFLSNTISTITSAVDNVITAVTSQTPPPRLHTISIPFTHFLDGKYMQPWFAATYYEGVALPAANGGLTGPHNVKVIFRESGGYPFYEVVEGMKSRLGPGGVAFGRGGEIIEPLPLYAPEAPSSSSVPVNTTTQSDSEANTIATPHTGYTTSEGNDAPPLYMP